MVPHRLIAPAKRVARWLPFPIVETFAFPNESQWMRLGRRRPGRAEPSVILFTLHKVASTFTNDVLSHLNRQYLGLQRMDWDKYIYNRVPRDSSAYIADRTNELFDASGYCYGVFREALPIQDLDRYRVLLVLRDPRDILTSHYFSEAHSHAPPLNKVRLREFEARRSTIRSMTIDEYVLANAGALETKLDAYLGMSRDHGITPITYEQMMGDWDGFMDRVSEQLRVDINPADRRQLRARGQIGVEHSGDVAHHRRRGTPGDHRLKLRPETVDQLTDRFTRHLEWLELDHEAIRQIDLRTQPVRAA